MIKLNDPRKNWRHGLRPVFCGCLSGNNTLLMVFYISSETFVTELWTAFSKMATMICRVVQKNGYPVLFLG